MPVVLSHGIDPAVVFGLTVKLFPFLTSVLSEKTPFDPVYAFTLVPFVVFFITTFTLLSGLPLLSFMVPVMVCGGAKISQAVCPHAAVVQYSLGCKLIPLQLLTPQITVSLGQSPSSG